MQWLGAKEYKKRQRGRCILEGKSVVHPAKGTRLN